MRGTGGPMRGAEGSVTGTGPPLISPMPLTVLTVRVCADQRS